MVVENLSNMRICYDEWMFIGNTEPIIISRMSKVGVKELHQKGIGTIFWSFMDD